MFFVGIFSHHISNLNFRKDTSSNTNSYLTLTSLNYPHFLQNGLTWKAVNQCLLCSDAEAYPKPVDLGKFNLKETEPNSFWFNTWLLLQMMCIPTVKNYFYYWCVCSPCRCIKKWFNVKNSDITVCLGQYKSSDSDTFFALYYSIIWVAFSHSVLFIWSLPYVSTRDRWVWLLRRLPVGVSTVGVSSARRLESVGNSML